MRNFDTGATRDSDENKYDIEAFFDPLVLEEYAAFMHANRKQADGKLRDGDNWQKGIPKPAYMKSLLRHVLAVWKEHRGHKTPDGLKKELLAVAFNTFGYLHELIKEENAKKEYITAAETGGVWGSAALTIEDLIEAKKQLFDSGHYYTHRYGALAHDQEPEEDEQIKSYSESFIKENSRAISQEEYNTSIPRLPRVEHGEVLRVYSERSPQGMDTLAPQVRTPGCGKTSLPI